VAPCPFCNVAEDRLFLRSDLGLAIFDSYPLTEGHALVVPKRHVARFFDQSPQEQSAIWSLVAQVREIIVGRFQPLYLRTVDGST
jgi:diadenosine tetraphosphate (Ap4A) HIT family hydrolase